MTQQNSHKNRSHVNLVFSSKRGSHFFSLQPFLHSSFFFFPFRTHSSHSKDKHYPQVFLRTRSNWGVVLIVIDRDHDRCIADATPRGTNYISPFFFLYPFDIILSRQIQTKSYLSASTKQMWNRFYASSVSFFLLVRPRHLYPVFLSSPPYFSLSLTFFLKNKRKIFHSIMVILFLINRPSHREIMKTPVSFS